MFNIIHRSDQMVHMIYDYIQIHIITINSDHVHVYFSMVSGIRNYSFSIGDQIWSG